MNIRKRERERSIAERKAEREAEMRDFLTLTQLPSLSLAGLHLQQIVLRQLRKALRPALTNLRMDWGEAALKEREGEGRTF